MNKRKLHHTWKLVGVVSYWYFLILAVVFLGIALIGLRQNNLTALRLRDNVLVVDKAGGNVEKALNELRSYIYSHMNTNLSSTTSVYPPIQLKYSYERDILAEKERETKASTALYNDAQDYCERTQPSQFYSAGRLTCIQKYLDSHPVDTNNRVNDATYKFDFASPTWSPDLAGWSLVLSGVFAMLFVLRLGAEMWMRNQFKHHA